MSTGTITAQDGTGDVTTPTAIEGFEPEAESGNIVHQLIAPGTIAVTLVGDLPRTGSFVLWFADDTTAEEARLMLGRPTSFVLAVPERPALGMTFVRVGRMSPAIHESDAWRFDVGFQEVEP